MTDQVRAGMTPGRTLLFAVAGGAAVGNLYWAQPLLDDIASSLGTSAALAGLLVTLTQVGYASASCWWCRSATCSTAGG